MFIWLWQISLIRTLKYIWVIPGYEVITRNHDDYIPCVDFISVCFINPADAKTRLFKANWVNIIAADALALCRQDISSNGIDHTG